jgi:hypothetical protein
MAAMGDRVVFTRDTSENLSTSPRISRAGSIGRQNSSCLVRVKNASMKILLIVLFRFLSVGIGAFRRMSLPFC